MANALNEELDENSVKYCLFPLNDSIESLNDYISKSVTFLAQYLCQHIWDKQSFNLKVISNDFGNHLSGVTNFGDNVEDEWLIVYILFELTRIDPNLVVKVEDSDGDFVLIESADHLPKWCQPINTLNRVYIYRQNVHLIPLKSGPFEGRTPSVREGIACIRQFSQLTKCDENVQKCIRKRIDCFPKRIIEYQHKSHCFVPLGVAALLKHEPTLISLAVKAFYNRTLDDLKVCQAMKYFPPENRVMRCVTFTRCLYAQLMGQNYSPDIKIGWNIPQNNSNHFKAHDLGMKIAIGFEILISSYKSLSDDSKEGNNFKDDERWKIFLNNLNKNGYFGEQLFGSKKHKELTKSAQNYFCQFVYDSEKPEEFNSNEYYGKKIYNCLRSLDIDEKEFENEAKSLEREDSDQWMNFDSEELDALLSEKFSSNNKSSNNCTDFSTLIPETLKAFVSNEKSGIKGAEAPLSTNHSKSTKIDFNGDLFGDALNSVLSLKVPHSDTDSSSSGMSDYSDNEDSLDSDDHLYQNDLNKLSNDQTSDKFNEMISYMKAMDQQLAATQVGQSFERKNTESNAKTKDNEDNEEYKEVDIDLNSLTNILESYKSERGNAGPATALFATMGVNLPDNTDNE